MILVYMNQYHQYIKRLVDEYGPIKKEQARLMLNAHFHQKLSNIDNYISQMCHFDDFEISEFENKEVIGRKGAKPDADMIHSLDVMTAFLPNIKWHRKGRDLVMVRFFSESRKNIKEICVIPVHKGFEWIAVNYADDKLTEGKCEIAIFLLEDKRQIRAINARCQHRFAVIEDTGAVFFSEK